MEHRVKIVIGANYGDEGKGLLSRYFTKEFVANGYKTVTVLHNGSAQRGHTADYEDGTRHVFHNFGAGTRDGCVTYYAKSFMVHPMDFCREIDELKFEPNVFCNKDCVVVTPFDMLADQIIEDYIENQSGIREYGSCCYGTWSTTDRIKQRPTLAYTVSDFIRGGFLPKMVSLISWMKYRIKQFGIQRGSDVPKWSKYLENDNLLWSIAERFEQDVSMFLRIVTPSSFDAIWDVFDGIVFEGAQGLLLDKNSGDEWHTTSNTGLKNPALILGKREFDAEVCYVSRTYMTRHGKGFLHGETVSENVGKIGVDQTNVFNCFQGNLRFAPLDENALKERIILDFTQVGADCRYHVTTAMTHCNELDYSGNANYKSYNPYEVLKNMSV